MLHRCVMGRCRSGGGSLVQVELGDALLEVVGIQQRIQIGLVRGIVEQLLDLAHEVKQVGFRQAVQVRVGQRRPGGIGPHAFRRVRRVG